MTGAQLVVFLALVPALCYAQLAIFRPKFGVPEFPLTNQGAFRVEVEAASGLDPRGWNARLANDLRAWTCSVAQAAYGRVVNCNSQTGYLLTVRAPAGIPPEVFDLTVGHAAAGSATSRHCVRPLPATETNFYILHFADPQVVSEKAAHPSGRGGRYGSVEAIAWCAPAINLINPRFLINTGDEVDNGVAALYPKYLDALKRLDVPLLITRGNNDWGSLDAWKRDIGPPTYSLRLGSFYIGMKDYLSDENLAWFTNDVAGSFADPQIAFRLFGQHFITGDRSYAPPPGLYPDLMLVGHIHIFATLSLEPYPVLASRKACDYGACAIFEFLRTDRGWTCPSIPVHGFGNVLTLHGDWGKPPRVACVYSNRNDGAALANTAFITNSLAYDFWDGRVRFLMRKSPAGFAVSGGDLVAEYDYAPTRSAALVRVNIRRNALTSVSIAPRGAVGNGKGTSPASAPGAGAGTPPARL